MTVDAQMAERPLETDQVEMTVLIIEDDLVDAEAVSRLLRKGAAEAAGVKFELVRVGLLREGLDRIEQGGIDLVLLDLGLPDGNGLDCLKRVTDACPEIPVVVLTGSNDRKMALAAVRAGAQDYLDKDGIASGELVRCLLYAVERKGFEHALEEKEKQLLQSQKMEAIGRLAGGVAHDFNNLLTIILGYTELVLSSSKLPLKERQEIVHVKEAGDKASALVRQLLLCSRKQMMSPQVVSLNQVVENLDPMFRRIIREDIELATCLDDGLASVLADPAQLDQVLINLVVNARDAMPEGGRLVIETANTELGEEHIGRDIVVKPGPYVMLGVSDSGVGMDEALQARIFEPFFSTKERDKGTGLGLSTTYGIVKQCGGHIWVYSEPGEGSSFKIYLPLYEGEVAEAVEPQPEASRGPAEKSVLLVEDDDLVRSLVKKVLEELGCTVYETASGQEAIERFEELGGEVDLLLTDVVMPGMNGSKLARIMRQKNAGLPVVFMSGYTDGAIQQSDIAGEEVVFMQKPFSPETLMRKLDQVFADQGGL